MATQKSILFFFLFFFTNRSFKGTSGMMFVSHKRSTFTQETAVRVQWATKSKQYVYFLRVAGSTTSFTSISIDFTVLHSGRTGRYCTCCGSELTEAQARSSAEAIWYSEDFFFLLFLWIIPLRAPQFDKSSEAGLFEINQFLQKIVSSLSLRSGLIFLTEQAAPTVVICCLRSMQ